MMMMVPISSRVRSFYPVRGCMGGGGGEGGGEAAVLPLKILGGDV